MCAGIRNSLLALRTSPYPLRSRGGRHTGLDSYVRERIFEHRRFTRSIICERRSSRAPVSGLSRRAFFSQRSGVESCRSKCGKRRLYWRICATEVPRCVGRKGTNPPLPDFEARVVTTRNSIVPMNAFFITYCYVLYRAARFAPRWINTLSCWNTPKLANIQSSLEALGGGEPRARS